MTELEKLADMLEKENIPFEWTSYSLFGSTVQQICSPSLSNHIVDAICGNVSIGGKLGLLEVMGSANPNLSFEGVKGNMTANEAFQYFTEM